MSKGYIFKLSFRPYTLEQACRVRYYIKACAQNSIQKACEDMNMSLGRVMLNCEPVMYPLALDVEHPTVFDELQEIAATVQEPVYNIIAGACGMMSAELTLNITISIYDHNQLIISHEVYKQ